MGSSASSLLETSRYRSKYAAGLQQRKIQPPTRAGIWDLLPQWSVPFALLSFHFLLLKMFALIWVFGRRINEG